MSDWLPEHDAALRKHLRAEMTALAAADALNHEFRTSYTRNSVISRARRIHVPLISRAVHHGGGHSVSTDSPKPKRAVTPAQRPDIAIRKAASGPKAPAVPFTPRPDPVEPRTVSLLELTDDTCRWPIGDVGAPGFCFCGNRPLKGLPYCAGHFRLGRQDSRSSTRPSFQHRRRA